jgi:hypothetical protein
MTKEKTDDTKEEKGFYTFLDVLAKLRKSTICFVVYVRPSAWNNSAPTKVIFIKFDIVIFFENLSRKFKYHLVLTRITGTVHEDVCIFMIIYRLVLRMRDFLHKRCRENRRHILLLTTFFFPPKVVRFIR